MFNSNVLEVIIGLVFIYLLYSLLATIIQEIIASRYRFRADNLKKAIKRMLDDGTPSMAFVNAFYSHPLIKYLGEDDKSKTKPAYIKPESFSKVIVDLFIGETNLKPGLDLKPLIQDALDKDIFSWKFDAAKPEANKINPETLLFLKSIWTESQGDIDKFKNLLENWFNETMDRAAGWYKKRVQRVLFIIGLVISVFFNLNTIEIAHKLEKDPELRKQVIQQADAFVKTHPNLDQELANLPAYKINQRDSLTTLKAKRDTLSKQAERLVAGDIKKVNNVLSLGWNHWNEEKMNCVGFFFLSLLGWFITALAISLGAPFWFDLLNKLMQLRSSVASKTEPVDTARPDNKPVQAVNRKG